jgi:transposase InsO family protein
MSRQNYYARRRQRQRRQVDGELVAQLVRAERLQQSRIGVRKLHWMLREALAAAGVKLGRDRMYEELRGRDLLVERLPAQAPRTTQSYHPLPIFQNLVKAREVKAPNEVWVSDISYVRTAENFVYLAIITDKFSRKIVGYHAGDSLEALGCVLALEMALAGLPAGEQPIHHSDRGCQYCSHEYVERLYARGLGISMTEQDHCAENALAERMNGILKQEYGLGQEFRSRAQARKAVEQAVYQYNHRRPHTALAYRVPAEVYGLGARALN